MFEKWLEDIKTDWSKWIEDILWAIHKILILAGIVAAGDGEKDTEEDYSGYLPKR